MAQLRHQFAQFRSKSSLTSSLGNGFVIETAEQPPNFTTNFGEIRWAVKHEMARTVEDFLSRRTRCLLLDARASIECSHQVAKTMAEELGQTDSWIEDQVREFETLASNYLLP